MTGDPARLPIGVSIGSIRAEPGWWLDAARRLDEAGYAGVWCWDHFIGKGDPTVPVVEAWTILSAAAAITTRATLGPFVLNVMNRHPSVVARMAATLQAVSGGRLVLGIGIGGHPAEHRVLGIPFPEVTERVARLEEAIAVIRALWTGGPVTRPSPLYPLDRAHSFPRPVPVPRIVVGGQSRNGARLAARLGDGWTAFDGTFERDLPLYLETLEAEGRRRAEQLVIVAFEGGGSGEDRLHLRPWVEEPREMWERWRSVGADGAIVSVRTEDDVRALLEAAGRW
ncbi:MAG: LLM class flavin-dependent oxidoreductase [Chloroflexi bacterium]|nr:LLM class flavin-dependent oxidoreductase [Chloroflexota bacterium]